jgi:protocatechuate 3,4-dioxygenase beta subunit
VRNLTALLSLVTVAAVGWLSWVLVLDRPADEPEAAAGPAADPVLGAPADPRTPTAAADASLPAPITGVVLGPDSRPLPGARVTLCRILSHWPAQSLEECGHFTTRADGTFSLNAPAELDLMVVASREGHARDQQPVPHRSRSVTVQLLRGHALEGQVLDSWGRPLPDCEVMVEPGPWKNRRAETTRSTARGRFRFDDLASGLVRVTARHPSFQPVTVTGVNIGTQRDVELRFRKRSLVVSGTASAGSGMQPVADAEVRAYPATWNQALFVPVVARTDARGRFELRGIGRGNLNVEVRHARHSTSSRLIAVSADIDDLQFELVARSRVSGRLLGQGAAGARLHLRRPGEPSLAAVAAADGSFAFDEPVSAGNVELELLGGELAFEKSGGLSQLVTVQESARTEVELTVVAASTMRGEVRDESGRPLAGVRVNRRGQLRGLFDPQELLTVTDERGAFEIRGLPAVPLKLVFEQDQHAKHELAVQGPSPGSLLVLEPVSMSLPGAVHGIVSRGGRGLEGALVLASNTNALEMHTITTHEGAFRLGNLPAGEYSLKAHYGTLPLISAPDHLIVEPGGDIGPLRLEFPAGRELSGIVTDGSGEPVATALLRVEGLPMSWVSVDDAGRFTIEVPPRDVALIVWDPTESIEAKERVGAASRDVRIVLPLGRRGTLTARVLGLPGPRPLTQATVRVRPVDGRSEQEHASAQRPRWVEMPGGKLRLPGAPAGRCRVVVSCDGYGAWNGEIDVPAGGLVDLGSLLLDPGATVIGLVVDEAGQPVVGARVHLGHESDLLLYPATNDYLTDQAGRFELRGVTKDWRRLVVQAEGMATKSMMLRIPADLLANPLRIVLSAGRHLVVRVEDAEGRPQDLRPVVLLQDGEIVDAVYTDFGASAFERRAPGSYTAYVPELPGARLDFEVPEGAGPHEVTLRESTDR